MNDQEFAGMNVMKGEALSYERRRKGKSSQQRMLQTDNGCCESVKMQQISIEGVKELPF